MNEVKNAIRATLLYADIFDSGLEKDDAWMFLISKKKIKKSDFLRVLQKEKIPQRDTSLFLRNSKKMYVSSGESVRKLALASRLSKKLSLIPTVCFIGVSGSTAFFCAEKKDDIDLFVITENNSIWITRLLLLLFLGILGVRRKKGDTYVADKFCLNMLIEKREMMIKKERQDLYTAHEIARMVPLFQRPSVYKKFLQKNKWITSFLPNSLSNKKVISIVRTKKSNKIFIDFLKKINTAAKIIQIQYMKHHTGVEVITDSFLAFHPFDYRAHVLREYEKRKKKYGII